MKQKTTYAALRSGVMWLGVFFLLFFAQAYSGTIYFENRPPDTVYGSVERSLKAYVKACDISMMPKVGTIRYRLLRGPGEINPETGEWVFHPRPKDEGKTYEVEIEAYDDYSSSEGHNCFFYATVVRSSRFTSFFEENACGKNYSLPAPGSIEVWLPLSKEAWWRGGIRTFLQRISPKFTGEIHLWGEFPLLSIVAPADVAYKTFEVVVGATDGTDTSFCNLFFTVVPSPTFRVSIGCINDALPGEQVKIPVTLTHEFDHPMELGGFDFVIVYDSKVLSLQNIEEGEFLRECTWEYFTYRSYQVQLPDSSHVFALRIISMADMFNGLHPSCFDFPTSASELFTLHLRVSNDMTLAGTTTPLRFLWLACNDNLLFSHSGDTMYTPRKVFTSTGLPIPCQDTFPSFSGVPSSCREHENTHPSLPIVDYQEGYVHIYSEPDPNRGDINLNGKAYEIADMVLFTNYFIYDTVVFTINPEIQIAATDMNADGEVLTVEDLEYGILVIVGDAEPYAKPDPSSPQLARFTQDLKEQIIHISTSEPLGAVFLVFEGKLSSFSVEGNEMAVKYAYNEKENITRVLIYSLQGDSLTSSDVFHFSPSQVLIEASAATNRAAAVKVLVDRHGSPGSGYLPDNFVLEQNYPNPFNSSTSISFILPHHAEVEFQILNSLGQVVYGFQKHYQAGWYQFKWDGTDKNGAPVASGVYYYRLMVLGHTETKKMVLIK